MWTYTSGDWVLTQHRRFVWSGWLMLVEFDVLGDCGTLPYDSSCVVRQYTWGLDLASSVSPLTRGRYGFPNSAAFLEGAGGIGGLVALQDPNDLYDPNDTYARVIPLYDGNGNVGQLISWQAASAAASVWAHYEYDPYGGVYASSGDYAAENPIRFSTKYFDAETGLGYWGYRYYNPTLGRWVSRDPIGEEGGGNVYAYASNGLPGTVDLLGLDWASLNGMLIHFGPAYRCPTRPTLPPSLTSQKPGRPITPGREPYGTCTKEQCKDVCTASSTYGQTVCRGGKPCYCVCPNNIHHPRDPKNEGVDGAHDQIEKCVAAHEAVHAAVTKCDGDTTKDDPEGQNEECKADIASIDCVMGLFHGQDPQNPVDPCSEYTRGDQHCRCLRAYHHYIKEYASCAQDRGTTCPDQADCEAKHKAALEAIHGVMQKLSPPCKL